MINFVTGDIFDSLMETIVDPVNTMGISGAGLALAVKLRYPEAERQYRTMCELGHLKVGETFFIKPVLFFPTKGRISQPARLDYIERGLAHFVKTYEDRRLFWVAWPKLGCGLGGLNWADIKPLMIQYLEPLKAYSEIYE